MKPKFKRRKRGTPKQIGKVFPVLDKKKLPTKISLRGGKIIALRSPATGAPLEPPTEYGETILYDPYGGEFAEYTPERQYGRVTPKYTTAEAVGMSMAKSYVRQAASIAGSGRASMKDFEKAALLIDQSSSVEPWHRYPEAGLQRNITFVEIREADNYVGSMLQSARETKDPIEKQKWIDKGMERIRNLNVALGG